MNKTVSSAGKAAISILIVLVCVNAVWAASSPHSGPLIGLLFYSCIIILCWKKGHFQAGVIAGIFGLAIHSYELISQGIGELGIGAGFFLVNLFLPIPLIYFSYRASRR